MGKLRKEKVILFGLAWVIAAIFMMAGAIDNSWLSIIFMMAGALCFIGYSKYLLTNQKEIFN